MAKNETLAWSVLDKRGVCIAISEGDTQAEADIFTAALVASGAFKYTTSPTVYKTLIASDLDKTAVRK